MPENPGKPTIAPRIALESLGMLSAVIMHEMNSKRFSTIRYLIVSES